MSIEATNLVWSKSRAKGSARLVLLCIANHINQEGVAWPSVRKISDDTAVSERQVSRAISDLEEMGEIRVVEKGDGRGRSTIYRITLKGDISSIKDDTLSIKGDMVSPNAQTEKGDMVSLKGDISSIKDDTLSIKGDTMSPQSLEPLKNHYEPLREYPPTPQGVSDGAEFEHSSLETDFWGKAQTLVSEWQGLIGDYRPLDANRRQDKTDFFAPALRMINDFGGDYAAAWQAVRAERERMIRDGLGNVRKLSAVVTGVLAGLERARLPDLAPVHQGNGNGRKLSNAEAGAVEYAAMRAAMVRSRQP